MYINNLHPSIGQAPDPAQSLQGEHELFYLPKISQQLNFS